MNMMSKIEINKVLIEAKTKTEGVVARKRKNLNFALEAKKKSKRKFKYCMLGAVAFYCAVVLLRLLAPLPLNSAGALRSTQAAKRHKGTVGFCINFMLVLCPLLEASS